MAYRSLVAVAYLPLFVVVVFLSIHLLLSRSFIVFFLFFFGVQGSADNDQRR